MLEVQALHTSITAESAALRLLRKLLDEGLDSVQPVLVPDSENGYAYPDMENHLHLKTAAVQDVLESLSAEKILDRQLSSSFLSCPHCHWSNLQTVEGCPNCGSDKISYGRILEHFLCGNLSLEDEYIKGGRYVCPKCKEEVRYLGKDYRSIGVKYSCSACGHIFDTPVTLYRCLKCSALFPDKQALQYNLYSYSLSPEERAILNFEFGAKQGLMAYLRRRGYTVIQHARISASSKSGEEHVFDLLASRYDGFIEYNLCIDSIINTHGEIGLDDVFRYDTKTYDLGLHDKVLLVMPRLGEKASNFARNQHIMVYTEPELISLLASNPEVKPLPSASEPVVFQDKRELVSYLKYCGYLVKERAQLQGRSGVMHEIDLFASLDDGLITHTVDIGIMEGGDEIGIDRVLLFDARAFDIRVHDKVLMVSSKLSREASSFAEHQRIKVYHFGEKQ